VVYGAFTDSLLPDAPDHQAFHEKPLAVSGFTSPLRQNAGRQQYGQSTLKTSS
jgi:hypothetical protein